MEITSRRFDIVDDIALLSSRKEHIDDKTDRLTEGARGTGLKCNTQKCKVMRINNRNNDRPVTLNGENTEDVETSVYLGATVSKEGRGTDDIKYNIWKARQTFMQLK